MKVILRLFERCFPCSCATRTIYILANVTNEHYLFLDCIYISLIVASCNSSFTEVLLSGAVSVRACRCNWLESG